MELEQPLQLELVPRRAGNGKPDDIGDLLTVNVRNVSDQARSLAPLDAGRLEFEVVGTEQSFPEAQPAQSDALANPLRIEPGKAVRLVGKDKGLRYTWVHPVAEKVRIRAYLRPYDEDGKESVRIISNWVDVLER
jgi:hypothetical protein